MACLNGFCNNHITWAVTLNILLCGLTPVMSGGTGYQPSYAYPGTRSPLTPYSHLGAAGHPFGFPGYPGYVGGIQYQPDRYGVPPAAEIGPYSPKPKSFGPVFSGARPVSDPRLYPGQVDGYGSPYVGSYGPSYQSIKPKPLQQQIPIGGGVQLHPGGVQSQLPPGVQSQLPPGVQPGGVQPQVHPGGVVAPVTTINGIYYDGVFYYHQPKVQQMPTGGMQPQVPLDQSRSQVTPVGTVAPTVTGVGGGLIIPSVISGGKQKYQPQHGFTSYPTHPYIQPPLNGLDATRSYGIPSVGAATVPVVPSVFSRDDQNAHKLKSISTPSGGWPSGSLQPTGRVGSPSGLVPPTSSTPLTITTGLPSGHQPTDQKPPKPLTPVDRRPLDSGVTSTLGGGKQKPWIPNGFDSRYGVSGYGLQGAYPSFTSPAAGTGIGQYQKPRAIPGYGTWPGAYGIPPQYYQQPTYGSQPYGTGYGYPSYLGYGQQQLYPSISATGSLPYKPK